MSNDLNIEKLDNPYIQVVWEDFAENFTQEKIKSVKHYFQKKYLTSNVNIITKTKVTQETTHSVDISFNILDSNYQLELVKSYLKSKNNENYYDDVCALNSQVDNNMLLTQTEATPFKKWYIRNIEFSNFLSYGENQRLDFEKCDGISVVESNPPNFGGKTVLSVDLLLFLFFNETTKTSKAEEIFNRFSDKNKVSVKGEIIIDGDEYVIVRNIERKKTKVGEWSVKTELDFFKKLYDGSLQNFTGEQRRETESFIKTSIGTKDDFLMTILTTASNLEELIDAKPTARGQVLSRFMGLDFLKKKEEVGKELYSQFSKSMLSNIYNTESLKTDNENCQDNIKTLLDQNNELNPKLIDVMGRIIKGQEYRDSLLKNKHTDIDVEISRLSPDKVNSDIDTLKSDKGKVVTQLENLKVVEPTSFYHEDDHDKVKEEYDVAYKEKVVVDNKIKTLEELKSSVDGGIKCEHCGIELMIAAITQSKIGELDGYSQRKGQINDLMLGLTNKEQSFTKLKKEFDEYEKNKLIKEKHELNIESYDLKIKNLSDKLSRYYELQEKISENQKTETLLFKAGLKIDELEKEKYSIKKQIDENINKVSINNNKIEENNIKIKKIAEESEKEKIYKIYLEIYGKNGITKSIMKTMMPLINSELQRLLQDSCHFRLEVKIIFYCVIL